MQHPCLMVNPNHVTWKYPDRLPDEPFYMVYLPCLCGCEVRVEAITVNSVTGRELQLAIQQQEMNNLIEQRALAQHLEQNYQYPPQNLYQDEHNSDDEDEKYEEIDEEGHENRNEAQRNWQNHWGQPNMLAPLPDNWLVYPEYCPEDEPIEEYTESQDLAMAREDYLHPGFNTENDSDDDIDR